MTVASSSLRKMEASLAFLIALERLSSILEALANSLLPILADLFASCLK
jgi:hypothetical protein